MINRLQVLVAIISIGSALSLKSGVLSDIHIQPFYDPSANNSIYCTPEITKETWDVRERVFSADYAPLGKIFCDSP